MNLLVLVLVLVLEDKPPIEDEDEQDDEDETEVHGKPPIRLCAGIGTMNRGGEIVARASRPR